MKSQRGGSGYELIKLNMLLRPFLFLSHLKFVFLLVFRLISLFFCFIFYFNYFTNKDNVAISLGPGHKQSPGTAHCGNRFNGLS